MPSPNRVPIATLVLVTPLPIRVGQEVVVDASGTTDVDGPPNKIKNIFYWGQDTDKTTTPGKPGKASYARGYDSVGTYDIVYEVIDHKGGKATAKVTIDVQAAETEPVPIDCIPGTVVETPGPWSECQPNGTQTRTVMWVREGDIPEQNGGVPCGPTSGSRVEEQDCLYVPPVEPPPSGKHEFFERHKALPTCVESRSFRDQAQLDAATPEEDSHTIWSIDAAKDAAKMFLPPRNTFSQYPDLASYGDVGDEGLPGRQTLRVPLNIADGRLLATWDFEWDATFQTNRGLLDGLKTFFLFTGSDLNSYWVLRQNLGSKDKPFFDMPPGGIGRHFDTLDPLNAADAPGVIGSGDPYQPTGLGACPLRTFWTMANKRTRIWVEVRINVPGDQFTEWTELTGVPVTGLWDMVSVWIADEDRVPTRVLYRVPVTPKPADVAFSEFRIAFNASTTNKVTDANPTGRGKDGPVIGWLRNLVVHHNYTSPAWESTTPENDLEVFEKP